MHISFVRQSELTSIVFLCLSVFFLLSLLQMGKNVVKCQGQHLTCIMNTYVCHTVTFNQERDGFLL